MLAVALQRHAGQHWDCVKSDLSCACMVKIEHHAITARKVLSKHALDNNTAHFTHVVEGVLAQNLSCSDSMLRCLHPACECGHANVHKHTVHGDIHWVPVYVAEITEQVVLMVAEVIQHHGFESLCQPALLTALTEAAIAQTYANQMLTCPGVCRTSS